MKNILTRGGIEFFAVLLGISGSLYIDEIRDEASINTQINDSFHSLKSELQSNVDELTTFDKRIEKNMYYFEIAMNPDTMKYLTEKELDKMNIITTTNWGNKMNARVFNSMEATGLIYKIKNDSLRSSIIELFNKKYEKYHYLLDYDLTHIQKWDDISLTNFIYRDDPEYYFWGLDWENEENIKQYRENVIHRNYLIANRANKRLIKANVIKLIKDTKIVIDKINNIIDNI